jgi:colicin import membrane protein
MSSVPSTISNDTMTLYSEVKRLEALLRSSRGENAKLRKKIVKILTKPAVTQGQVKFEKEKAKFEKEKIKFEKEKANFAIANKLKAEKAKAKKEAKAIANKLKAEKAKAKKVIASKLKAEKAKAKKALASKLKVEKAEAKKALASKLKVEKSKVIKTEKSEAQKLKKNVNKQKLIKKYNEISIAEEQITIDTPLKNGEITKMISIKKKQIKEDKKSRKASLSTEMIKIVSIN